jgi:hypothetical protein
MGEVQFFNRKALIPSGRGVLGAWDMPFKPLSRCDNDPDGYDFEGSAAEDGELFFEISLIPCAKKACQDSLQSYKSSVAVSLFFARKENANFLIPLNFDRLNDGSS